MVSSISTCDYEVLCGDNLVLLPTLDADCVDLVVTSPPYNCNKNYEVISDNLPWNEYWDRSHQWLNEVYRVLKDGARLAVNLPWWMGSKPRRDVVSKFKQTAQDAGFSFLDKIIWIKGDSNNVHTSGGWGTGGCGWGTYMSPSGPAIRCASEPILIFSKGGRGRRRISGKGNGDCVKGDMTKEEWMSWTLDVWFIRGASSKHHPAVFPEDIPRRLIKLYTYPGEVVLDPFCGIGTTGKAACSLGRSFIGIEINPTYCDKAAKR